MSSSTNQSKSPFTKQQYLYGIVGVLIIAVLLTFSVQGNLLGGNFTVNVDSSTGVTAARMKLVPNKLTFTVGEKGTAQFKNVPPGSVLYADGCGKLFYIEAYTADNLYVVAPGYEPCPGTTQSVVLSNNYKLSFTLTSPGKYHLVAVMGTEGHPETSNLVSSRFTVDMPAPTVSGMGL